MPQPVERPRVSIKNSQCRRLPSATGLATAWPDAASTDASHSAVLARRRFPMRSTLTMTEPRPIAVAEPAPDGTGFLKRHPLLTFYVLAFAISWAGIFLVIGGPGNFPG